MNIRQDFSLKIYSISPPDIPYAYAWLKRKLDMHMDKLRTR